MNGGHLKRCKIITSMFIPVRGVLSLPLVASTFVDCQQSLSFPSVFRTIERSNERAVSGAPRAASREKRGRGEKEKERDCGGIFDLFDLPPLTPV